MNLIRKIITLALACVLLMGTFSISASAAGTVNYGIGFVKADQLRLRAEPNTTSSVLATATNAECVVVISKSGQWYKVNYNLQEGYMHEDYLIVSQRENAELGYGQITGRGVNMRSGPATTYPVVTTGSNGSKCYIIGINDGWYKVIYNNNICYIRSDFVKLTEYPYENKASSNSPKFFRNGKSTGTAPTAAALNNSSTDSSPKPATTNTVSVSGNASVAEAKKYLGTRYLAGGASPNGFDCSGLVYYVLKQVGYAPQRTPAAQINHGTPVSKDSLQPGDIVFFAGTGAAGISHVGIYAGNGQFIHAPNSRTTVSYSSLTSGYWAEHYYAARRMS